MIDVGPRKRRRLENLARRRGDSAAVLALADRLDLHLGAVVWIARLLVSLLVHLQTKLALFFGSAILTALTTERDVSALPATLRRLRIRTAHDHSQQPAVSVFPGEIHSATRLADRALVGLIYGLNLKEHWRQFALFWNQPATNVYDPIFGKSLGFYLFSLPFYDVLSSWLLGVTFIILLAALAYWLLGLPQTVLKPSVRWSSGAAFRGVCCALALFLLV